MTSTVRHALSALVHLVEQESESAQMAEALLPAATIDVRLENEMRIRAQAAWGEVVLISTSDGESYQGKIKDIQRINMNWQVLLDSIKGEKSERLIPCFLISQLEITQTLSNSAGSGEKEESSKEKGKEKGLAKP